MSEAHGPLRGVKVVACSTAQAGTVPYMLMADLGAEVIKIEVPDGGDNSRVASRASRDAEHVLRDEQPRREERHAEPQARRRRARSCTSSSRDADIFGQNFRPGAAEKNGFGYEDLRKINPKLVYVSISGYGPKGPNADLPGTDSMAQALGGIAQAYSTPGQPMKIGVVSVADETCAILAFGGVLAALTHARTHRRRPEGRLLAARRPDPADGLDADDGDVAQPRSGHRPGARHRHAASGRRCPRASTTGTASRSSSSCARDQWKEAMTALGFYEAHGPGRLRRARRRDGVGRGARSAAEDARRAVRDRPARRMGGAAAQGATSSRRRSTRCSRPSTIRT